MNTTVQTWQDAVQAAFNDVLQAIITYLPNILGAMIIVLVGLLVGAAVGKAVEKVAQLLRVDHLFEKFGIKRSIERMGLKLSVAKVLGWMVKWFVYVITFLAVANALQLSELSHFVNNLLMYIPNVIVAVLILTVGVLLAHFVAELVMGAAEGAKFKAASFVATVTRYSIVAFSILAALVQLGIATGLLQTLFMGVVGAIALAVGLAFGFGGQGVAREILEKLKRDLEG
jgi:small-conductance mechanosensitive channel